MRHIAIFLLTISFISYSGFAWAATCEYCYEIISKGERYCEVCKLRSEPVRDLPGVTYEEELIVDTPKPSEEQIIISTPELLEEQIINTSEPSRDLYGMRSGEEQHVDNVNSSRENYKAALSELIQYYLDTGYQFRLKKARKELKALNKVPQSEYLAIKDEAIPLIRPVRNIEAANILFQDGKMYKKSLWFFKKSSKLLSAIRRYKMIINNYAESDKADDAAYEIARIYNGFYFKDYEGAAYYYVTCYELNPDTDKPARYMAARVYDKHLKDYARAIQNYEMALQTCKVKRYRKKAKKRLDKLREQGF